MKLDHMDQIRQGISTPLYAATFFFQNNSGLKALRMTGNKIENRGGMFFAQMLQVNTTLEALDLGDTDLVSV